jgi:hypothetical protein
MVARGLSEGITMTTSRPTRRLSDVVRYMLNDAPPSTTSLAELFLQLDSRWPTLSFREFCIATAIAHTLRRKSRRVLQ